MASSTPDNVLQATIAKAQAPEFLALMSRLLPRLPDHQTYRDYALGLRHNFTRISKELPSVLCGGLRILDVGPGVGCFLLLARDFGNIVYGEDIAVGTPGRRDFASAYQEIARYWNLPIRYHGFHRYLDGEPFPYAPGLLDVIHLCGSLDGVVLSARSRMSTAVAVAAFLALCDGALAPGGILWIGHNQDALLKPTLAAIRDYRGALRLVEDQPTVSRLVKQ